MKKGKDLKPIISVKKYHQCAQWTWWSDIAIITIATLFAVIINN